MRLELTSANPIEWLLIRFGIVPTPLVLGFWGMSASRVILSATELGIFDALDAGPKTAEQIARELSLDPFGTEVLLNALNGLRYVRRRDGAYRNATPARRWLTRSAKHGLSDSVLFYSDLWDVLGTMTRTVASGDTTNLHYDGRSPEFWRHYLVGLGAFAKLAGPQLARSVRLPAGAMRLLDVGGGHGLYSAAFVARNPGLTATVLDLPEACEQGRALVATTAVADRISFREGDVRVEDWGEGYDVVLLFNLIHNLTPDESRDALSRARGALRPGGIVVVLEGEHEATSGDLSLNAGMNELLFYLTSGTRTYPEVTIGGWMEEAGLTRPRVRRLRLLPMSLIIATRPD